MPKYLFRVGSPQIEGMMPYLGEEIDYPFELRTGDVVIISEKMQEELLKHLPDYPRVQFWAGSVHHSIGGKTEACPVVFLTDYNPVEKLINDILDDRK